MWRVLKCNWRKLEFSRVRPLGGNMTDLLNWNSQFLQQQKRGLENTVDARFAKAGGGCTAFFCSGTSGRPSNWPIKRRTSHRWQKTLTIHGTTQLPWKGTPLKDSWSLPEHTSASLSPSLSLLLPLRLSFRLWRNSNFASGSTRRDQGILDTKLDCDLSMVSLW